MLLVSPALIKEVGPFKDTFIGAAEKSASLAGQYESVAAERGVHFLDAAQFVEPSDLDGIHFEPEGHASLGRAIAAKVKEVLP